MVVVVAAVAGVAGAGAAARRAEALPVAQTVARAGAAWAFAGAGKTRSQAFRLALLLQSDSRTARQSGFGLGHWLGVWVEGHEAVRAHVNTCAQGGTSTHLLKG